MKLNGLLDSLGTHENENAETSKTNGRETKLGAAHPFMQTLGYRRRPPPTRVSSPTTARPPAHTHPRIGVLFLYITEANLVVIISIYMYIYVKNQRLK